MACGFIEEKSRRQLTLGINVKFGFPRLCSCFSFLEPSLPQRLQKCDVVEAVVALLVVSGLSEIG